MRLSCGVSLYIPQSLINTQAKSAVPEVDTRNISVALGHSSMR